MRVPERIIILATGVGLLAGVAVSLLIRLPTANRNPHAGIARTLRSSPEAVSNADAGISSLKNSASPPVNASGSKRREAQSRHRELGVSRHDVIALYTKEGLDFTFSEETPGSGGIPVMWGKSPDRTVQMELLGPPDNLYSITILAPLVEGRDDASFRNTLWMAGLFKNFAPGSDSWFLSSLKQIGDASGDVRQITEVDGKRLTFMTMKEVSSMAVAIEGLSHQGSGHDFMTASDASKRPTQSTEAANPRTDRVPKARNLQFPVLVTVSTEGASRLAGDQWADLVEDRPEIWNHADDGSGSTADGITTVRLPGTSVELICSRPLPTQTDKTAPTYELVAENRRQWRAIQKVLRKYGVKAEKVEHIGECGEGG